MSMLLAVIRPHLNANGARSEIIPLIRQVATDYRERQWFQDACSINWNEVSLGALMYALAIQEWWWKPWSLWYRTNNWLSVWGSRWHYEVTYIKADGRKNRASFKEPYHGLYEAADLITHSKHYNNCNISYKQLFAYIAWPNQSPNHKHPARWGKTAQQWVTYKLGLLEWRAKEYEGKKADAPVAPANTNTKPTASLKAIEDDTKRCYLIDHTGLDFIQLDSLSGELVWQVHNHNNEVVKIFKCEYK